MRIMMTSLFEEGNEKKSLTITDAMADPQLFGPGE